MSINRKVTRDIVSTIFHNTVRGDSFVVTSRRVGLASVNTNRWFWYIFEDVYVMCRRAQIPVRSRDVTINGIRSAGEFWAEQFERFKHSIFEKRGL